MRLTGAPKRMRQGLATWRVMRRNWVVVREGRAGVGRPSLAVAKGVGGETGRRGGGGTGRRGETAWEGRPTYEGETLLGPFF